MAVRAVQQLQIGAVRVDAVEIELVVVDVMFPAREDDASVRQHRRVEVVALVERDLVDVRAVVVHHVQHERRLLVVLVLGCVLRLVLIEQDRARLALARRAEHDPAVRQVVRHDVVAFVLDRVRGDDPAQRIGRAVELPDVPGRLVFLVRAFDELRAHREHDLGAVEVHVQVADVAETFGLAGGDVDFGRGDRGAVAHEQVGADLEATQRARVVDEVFLLFLGGDRALHVERGEVERDRILVLAAADRHVRAAAAAAACCEHAARRGDSDRDGASNRACGSGLHRVTFRLIAHCALQNPTV